MNKGQQASDPRSLFPLQGCVKLCVDSDYPAELKFMRYASNIWFWNSAACDYMIYLIPPYLKLIIILFL